MGIPAGKTIGSILNRLLEDVIEDRVMNDREKLLVRALEYKGEYQW